MPGPLVEMVVESVRVHMLSSQHVVILKEVDRDRYLPIWIGPWEANAIAMRLQGIAADRPLTHDLFATAVEELGGEIRQVVISDLTEDTFHARLFLAIGELPAQFATAAHLTIWTKMISFRKDHIKNELAGINHHFGICLYFHSLGYRKCT